MVYYLLQQIVAFLFLYALILLLMPVSLVTIPYAYLISIILLTDEHVFF